MNKTFLMGRLTADPDVRLSKDNLAIARYTLAVDRRTSKEASTDFIRCVVFGKGAEFAEKYFHKGQRVLVSGSIKTGSYKDKEGRTVNTTEVLLETQEFADSKGATNNNPSPADDFMQIPDNVDDMALPFN